MSADNFYLVRKHNGKYYTTMFFLSDYEDDEEFPPLNIETERKRGREFNTFAEVQAFLGKEYAEYPPVFDFPTKLIDISDQEP